MLAECPDCHGLSGELRGGHRINLAFVVIAVGEQDDDAALAVLEALEPLGAGGGRIADGRAQLGDDADVQAVNKPKTNQGKNELFKKGGEMKESKGMMKKEISFMKAKGAPKSMVKHEMAEMKGMKKGGSVGQTKMGSVKTAAPSKDGVAVKGKTKVTMVKMAKGGYSC